jgi:GT2 family glycosyltransferase
MTNSEMANPASVTIVVSPCERYGLAKASLESLYQNTSIPFDLIYVTSAAPSKLVAWIDEQAKTRNFTHLRHREQITPNEARNHGARLAKTTHIAFVDNDVEFAPGWLDRLLACARETGAEVVTPLTCHNTPFHTFIHHVGSTFTPDPAKFFATPKGERDIEDVIRLQNARVTDTELVREPTQCCEFHCVLVQRAALQAVGGFDEQMLATRETIDFSMQILERGGVVMFEPSSIVTYLFPTRATPIEGTDLAFFAVRWSPEWQRKSLAHFAAKWGLKSDGYIAHSQEKDRLFWRHYEGIVKPKMRQLGWLARVPILSVLARKAITGLTRGATQLFIARADRAQARLTRAETAANVSG